MVIMHILISVVEKRGKNCPKMQPMAKNASFLLVEIWQDHVENDFEDNDQDFGCGKIFMSPICEKMAQEQS